MFQKLIKNKNIMSLGGNVSFAFFGFASFLLLSRMLRVEEFGIWILFITLATFMDLFRFGLTRSAIIKFSAGVSTQQKTGLLASSFTISLLEVAIIFVIFMPLQIFFGKEINSGGYGYFIAYYPFLAIANMSWNNALSMLQADERFDLILLVRSLVAGLFLCGLPVLHVMQATSAQDIIFLFIAVNTISSIVCFLLRWDGAITIKNTTRQTMAQLFNYGKYSIGTIAGSSLLRSADTFIIGLSPVLGPTGIALYAIPLKLVEVIEIPLRSFCATAFPRMSSYSNSGDTEGVTNVFYSYAGVLTILFLPMLAIAFLWADKFVWLLGGAQFQSSAELLGNIFRIFAIYGLLLPIDRLTGVALDSINQPKRNMIKVVWMVTANIIGDTIAVFYFESLPAVAWSSVAFTLIGILFGLYFLHQSIRLSFRDFMRTMRFTSSYIKQKFKRTPRA